jgi:hypothetical protein
MPLTLPTKFGSFRQAGSEKKILEIDQSQARIAMFLKGSGQNEQTL